MSHVKGERPPAREEGTRPVWIDCDPGHDDFVAVMLAWAFQEVLGISTVHGNAPLKETTVNALRAAHVCGRYETPIVAGADRPLLRDSRACPAIHGESGLGGFDFPALPDSLRSRTDTTAVQLMHDTIHDYWKRTGKQVTLLVTGCHTNIALLLAVYPDITDALEEIIFLGGAIGIGNTHPAAEFNIEIDPEAFAMVLRHAVRVRLTMIPLEVSHTALVSESVLERIDGLPSSTSGDHRFSNMLRDLLLFFRETYADQFEMPDPPLHDPCAVFFAMHPECFETRWCQVAVETGTALSAGRTLVDLLHTKRLPESGPVIQVALRMDVDAFWDRMMEAWGRFAENPWPERG